MNAMISTVAVIHKLEAAGFNRKQAEAQVEAVAELVAADSATKTDIMALDRKIDETAATLERKIDALDRKIDETAAALNYKIDALDRKIDETAAALDRKIDALRSDMEKMEMRLTIKMGAMLAASVAIVAAMVKLL